MMRIATAGLVVLLALGLATSSFVTPVLAGESMAATARLNVRSGPGLDHQVLDTLDRGERVLVTQCRDAWCQITHVGINGWVYSPYLVSAQFSQSWSTRSKDLPPTLPNDTGDGAMPNLSIELGRAHW